MKAGLRSRPWVGLDVGTYSVKVVAAHGGVGGARYGYAEAPLMGLRDDVHRTLEPDRVAHAIARCMDECDVSVRSVRGISMGLSGPDVIIKQITLPLLDDSEVAPALRFESRKHLPFDPQTMIIDYQIIARLPSERKLEVLLAAVARDHAERELQPLKILGVEPDILDATPLALANSMVHGAEIGPEAHVLLDIGNGSSHLIVFQRGQPFFARRLDFGGRNLTRAISTHTKVPFEEAEEWKLVAGGDNPSLRLDWNTAELQAILDCLRREVVQEVHRTLAFYRTQAQLPDLSRLWVSGGAARLPGLSVHLGELLGVPVMLFDPFRDAASPGSGGTPGGPQFAQAFGLALRAA